MKEIKFEYIKLIDDLIIKINNNYISGMINNRLGL